MNIIWDMGGTLIDTYTPLDAMFTSLVREHGGELTTHDIALLTRVSISNAMQTIADRYGIAIQDLQNAYEQLKESWKTNPAPLNPGAHEALDRVHQNGELNLVVTHRDRQSATTLIKQHELPIDLMVCAPDGFARKPDPEMFNEVLNQTELSADQVISVGDREIDILASHGAGIKAALLKTPGIPVETTADWEISALLEIFDIQSD